MVPVVIEHHVPGGASQHVLVSNDQNLWMGLGEVT